MAKINIPVNVELNDLVSERTTQLNNRIAEDLDHVVREALDKHVPGWSENALSNRCHVEHKSGIAYYYVDNERILEVHPASFSTENSELSVTIPYRIL